MKALTLDPFFAMDVMECQKTVECRTWKTDYRGDILICSSAKKRKDTIPGHALCVVTLKDIVPFTKAHLKAACMFDYEYADGCYAWLLENVRLIYPFAVKGKLSLWNCEHDIKFFDGIHSAEEWDEFIKTYYEPLYV